MKRYFGKSVVTAAIGLAAVMLGSEASAQSFVVKVSAHSRPWPAAGNSKFAFGSGPALGPTMIWNAHLTAGLKVKFTATGEVSWIGGGAMVGPAGDPRGPINDHSLTALPSAYIPHPSGPIYICALVGAFLTADGKIVGKPFDIGSGAVVVIPEGAAAIALGVNDDKVSDNSGYFTVTVDLSDANVTVEESK